MKPRVVVSKCIEFENCRWDGLGVSSEIVRKLKEHIEFLPFCPEVEIGLGVPRNPIRIVVAEGGHRLVQPAAERDLTDDMSSFVERFLESLPEIDGFILKSRSPSCGLEETKLYASADKPDVVGKVAGFFGRAVRERFPELPIENEEHLDDLSIRKHFLEKIISRALRRETGEEGSRKDIDDYIYKMESWK